MADIVELIEQAGAKAGLSANAINNLKAAFSNLTQNIEITAQATDVLNSALDKIVHNNIVEGARKIGRSLADTSLLTEKQTDAFAKLNMILSVTSKSFTDMGASNLNTFKGQLDSVLNGIGTSIEPLKDLAKALHVPTTGLESFEKLKGLVVKYAGNMAENADEALRFQNTILKTAAAAGSLDKIIEQSGKNFGNFTNVLAAQTQYLNEVNKATQESPEIVRKYYTQLAQIPGALESTVKGANESEQGINMLTAAMQFSKGSGREFEAVVEDLKTAFVDYNLVGEDALRFTSRIGQLSNNYNIQLDKVRSAVISVSSALKMFGHDGEGASKMMEGASKMMNNYIQSLKDTGISGAAAIDVINNMAGQIGKLDVAQRSFISSQTGGTGGLRGAFQIEQMIREENIDQVMEKVRKTMTQQFGKIVSVEEASKSESAASALVKQRMMLMQGPLGGLARNEQEAGRLVEAFSAMEKGGGTKELTDILQTTMQQGNELQKQTATPMSMVRADTDAIRKILQVGGLEKFQQLMTAGGGKNLTAAQQERSDAIAGAMSRGATRGGQMAGLIGGGEGDINDNNRLGFHQQNINDFKASVEDVLPKTLHGFLDELGIGNVAKNLQQKRDEYTEETTKLVEKSKGMSGREREKIEKEIAKRRKEEESMAKGIGMVSGYESSIVMENAATNRYNWGDENSAAIVGSAIPETAPALAATGGVPGRRGEGERSAVEVKIEPETIVFEIRNEKGEVVSSQTASVNSAVQLDTRRGRK